MKNHGDLTIKRGQVFQLQPGRYGTVKVEAGGELLRSPRTRIPAMEVFEIKIERGGIVGMREAVS